jgi:hypothetical protein
MSGKHAISAKIIARHPNVWQAKCGRHFTETGPTYEAIDDAWRQHVYEETGYAPQAWGDTSIERWEPR